MFGNLAEIARSKGSSWVSLQTDLLHKARLYHPIIGFDDEIRRFGANRIYADNMASGILDRLELHSIRDSLRTSTDLSFNSFIESLSGLLKSEAIAILGFSEPGEIYIFGAESNLRVFQSLNNIQENILQEPAKLPEIDLPKPAPQPEKALMADVGGQQAAKDVVSRLLKMLKRPEIFEKWGAESPRGILFYGPPGVGKTLMGRAISNEIDADFIELKMGEILSMWVNKTSTNLHAFFESVRGGLVGCSTARHMGNAFGDVFDEFQDGFCTFKSGFLDKLKKISFPKGAEDRKVWIDIYNNAQARKVVIFFDEIDAMFSVRNSSTHDETKKTLAVMNVALDGIKRDKRFVVIGTTNRPDTIDPSLLRRFNRKAEFTLPDAEERTAIFMIHSEKACLRAARTVFLENWFKSELAEESEGFSGDDIRECIRRVLEKKAMDESDGKEVSLVSFEDVLAEVVGYEKPRIQVKNLPSK